MKLTAVCLGILLMLSGTALAQGTQSEDQSPPPTPSTQSTSAKTPSQAANSATPKEEKTKEAVPSDRKYHVRLGGIAVGGGYVSGPFWPYYYPGPYGYYAPSFVYSSLFWDPFWGGYPGFYPAGYFRQGYGKGEVRLQADPKNATVLIDGAYAGTADKLRTMWLDPGAYNLTVSMPGRESYEQRIYVLSGKSLRITAKLAPKKIASGQEE
jgi:hypothetical protein